MERKDELTILGKNTVYKQDYAPEVLEAFVNKHPENDYWVRFNCPEFTSLCPITGQPDFAEIRISYLPDVKMVESKSLKLYLFSFRNHGDFHEDCVNIIMKDLIKLMDPKYIEVSLLLVVEYPFIRIVTTVVLVRNMRNWQNIVCRITICKS
jgi:7-cyano-7-deazaguanine reductase